jgi:hypothetical protein
MSATATQTLQIIKSMSKPSPAPLDHDDYVETYLNYFKAGGEILKEGESGLSGPELRVARRSDDSPNVSRTKVRIKNTRNDLKDYELPVQGFQICPLNSEMSDWSDDSALKKIYFHEVSELLKKVTGARHVHSYEHHIRRGTLQEALANPEDGEVDINGPVRRVHIDESPRSAKREFEYYLPSSSSDFNARLHERPFGIYNTWKPLKTIHRDPLCVIDARSLIPEDLVPGAVTVPNVGEIENFSIKAPSEQIRHKWYFLRHQAPEEALVFKIFDERDEDSEGTLKRFGVAHTSFEDPETADSDPRESVEVRSFCFF